MTLVDVNILVYVTNTDTIHHERVRTWWESLLASGETVLIPFVVLAGYVRVTTNHRTMSRPATVDEALGYVHEWLSLPQVRSISEPPDWLTLFAQQLIEAGEGGNLVTDAHLAAIAIGNGAKLASCDVDFARFSKLRWVNPLAA
jgi:toxin-antitoxin system PIN domain toxin